MSASAYARTVPEKVGIKYICASTSDGEAFANEAWCIRRTCKDEHKGKPSNMVHATYESSRSCTRYRGWVHRASLRVGVSVGRTATVDEYSCRSGQPEGFPSHRRPALLQLMLRRRVSIALLGRLLYYAAVLASSIAQMDWPVSRAAPVGPVVSQVSETSQRDTREGFAWRFSLD